jgi:hypothetical protein
LSAVAESTLLALRELSGKPAELAALHVVLERPLARGSTILRTAS